MTALMTTREAANLLGKQAQTLRLWRLKGVGPRYIRFGGPKGRVGYSDEDLKRWIAEHTFQSTSEEVAKSL